MEGAGRHFRSISGRGGASGVLFVNLEAETLDHTGDWSPAIFGNSFTEHVRGSAMSSGTFPILMTFFFSRFEGVGGGGRTTARARISGSERMTPGEARAA